MSTQVTTENVQAVCGVNYSGVFYNSGDIIQMKPKDIPDAVKAGAVKAVAAEAEIVDGPVDELMALDVLKKEQAEALVDAGFNCIEKIRDAEKAELVAVSSIGEATADKLKEAADAADIQ